MPTNPTNDTAFDDAKPGSSPTPMKDAATPIQKPVHDKPAQAAFDAVTPSQARKGGK